MADIRVLHFKAIRTDAPPIWTLSCPNSKGMPIQGPATIIEMGQPTVIRTNVPGLLEAVTSVVGEDGTMYGWRVYTMGQPYEMPVGIKNAIVVVVRDGAGAEEVGMTVEEVQGMHEKVSRIEEGMEALRFEMEKFRIDREFEYGGWGAEDGVDW
ncbi:MAG: hypothetical protein L6R42_005261 [Xanthoria sp. 1 TBL-2021]|nr:MAG: hypothetical protein L6R42_005261 [Xanthoria sp. 1 TBL-2021]